MTTTTTHRAKLPEVEDATQVDSTVFVTTTTGVTRSFSKFSEEYEELLAQGVPIQQADDHPQLWAEVRRMRSELLASSDWTQLPDIPEETRMKWQSYRQKLRDITKDYELSSEVEWPAAPVQ